MTIRELAEFTHQKAIEFTVKNKRLFPEVGEATKFSDIHPRSIKRYIYVAKEIKKALGAK